ncbi:MAG: ABC transporter ATP-binding protein [Bacteroidales bacterium]|nr:ABC transporter ATP-binding protein [Bacteroidales bacterium]
MQTYSDKNILLSTSNLSVGYRTRKKGTNVLLSGLNLEIKQGELITLIGPNGCGKSTLIRSLCGVLPLLKGTVTIGGLDAASLTVSQKSDILGVVLTDPVYEKNMTIFDLVAMGRYHFTNWIGNITSADMEIIGDVLKKTGLAKKAANRLSEVSDGERQRAMIAKVLAQDVDLIILDEPTAHLDLSNRMELLLLLKKLSRKMGKGILLSTHELGLGMQVSDKVWLIDHNGNMEQSIPEELILNNSLNHIFGNNHISFHPFSASFELNPDKGLWVNIIGDGIITACVIRLIKRLGINIARQPQDGAILIEVDELRKEIIVNSENPNTFLRLIDLQNYFVSIINHQKYNN